MVGCWHPVSESAARTERVLLDTEDPYDAWSTGRERPESADDGDGLKVIYDGTGTIPCMSVYGPDGEVEFRGVDEIRAMYAAFKSGLRYAEAFGPPIPVEQWRQLNG